MTVRVSVLLAEDEERLRAALKLSLQSAYDVTDVPDGREGIEAVRRREFSVIVTDVVMPDADGMQLLHVAREHWPETAVILMTAHGDRVSSAEAERLGAFGYLVKPFDIDELRAMIDRALGLRATTRETDGAAREDCPADNVDSPAASIPSNDAVDSRPSCAVEASYVEAVLGATSWNLDEAAEALGIPFLQLLEKIRAYNLRPPG